MRKLFTLLIVLFLWAGSSWGQVDVQIGSGTTTTTYLPIYSCYNYSYSQQIYLGSELQNAGGGVGTINKIRFYYASGGTTFANWSDWTVYLGNTTKTVFANTTDWEPYENLTQVFTGTITPVTGSWVEITLTTPYNYTGGNLIVAVDENSPNYSCTASWRSFASGSNRGILYYSDGTNPDPASPPAANYGPNASISQIQFNMAAYVPTTPPNCATLVSPADAATNVPVGATLNWASGGGAPTGYNLYFGADELPATPIDLGLVTTYDPAGDMDYSTTYYWKVVPYNDNGDATVCAVWSFTTGPDPTVTVFPFTEGFEGATFPPYGWSQITVSGTSPWIMSTTSPHSGLQCARAPWASAGGEHLLITPPLDLTTVDYRLKFWLKGSSSAGTDLEVQIATNNSSASNFTTTLATYIAGTNMPTVWTEQIIDLSAYEDIQYIAFRLIDDDGYAFYIDDVTIEEIPATPVFSVSPSTKDFGTLAVGGSLSQVFTISNTGGGTLVINPAISVTGTDADQFVLTDANTYPLNLTAGQTATVSVAFTPTSAGEKSASLVIIDNLGSKATNTVPLTGTGFTPPPGSTCDNPYPIDLPLESFAGNTATMGDDYSSTWITPNSSYMNGDDMVFEFTLTEAGYLSGSMTSPDTWIGLFILEDCPDPVTPAAVIRSATSTGSSVSFTDQLMQAGTYFAIVSSYPSPQSIAFTLNLAFEPLPDCLPPTGLSASVTSTSANLSWTEAGTATAWEYVYGPAPLEAPTGAGTATSSSTDNPITSLTPGTPYQFYVRAMCDSPSTWAGPASFSTTQIPATLPLTEGFESGFGSWAVVNGTQLNTWFAGTAAVPHSGTNSAFITNDGGTSYSYTIDAASVVHIYRDIEFSGGEAAGYSLKFWYKGLAEPCCDYMKVFIVDPSTLPVAGTQLTTGQIGVNYNQQADYVEVTLAIPNTVAGTKRLVFSWRNDGSIGPNPPVSLDDISLQVITTGAVRGEVTDCYTGALLEGVTVSIAGSTTTTDANGYYEFPAIATGTYDLTASLSGYFNKTITGVVISEGATTTQDICLNIYVDPPLNLQASVENQDVHLTWLDPGALGNAFTEGFEAGTLPTGWLAIDNDGDAFNWVNTIEQAFGFSAHTGSGAMTSASYDNTAGALTPDNWLISPAISVTATSDLSWWHSAQDPDWPDEQYYVKVSTTGTALTDFTTTIWSGITPGDWAQVTVSLSAFAGQTIYIAWQHTDVTDMFWMKLDDVVVTNTASRGSYTPIVSNRTSIGYPFKTAGLTPEQIEERFLAYNDNGGVRSTRALTGYNVYRDEVFLNYTTLTEYDDLSLPAGTYSYTVTAVYNEGESEPAGPVTVEIITCSVPTNVQVTDYDQTTATIEWTAPAEPPANGYEYEVRSDGDPGSGAIGLAAFGATNGTTANITELEDGTVYMVYVRSVCGDANYSNWTGGVQFTTPCDARNLPFTEDFEASSPNLSCWVSYNIDGAGTYWGLSSAYNHTEGGVVSALHAYGPSTNTEDGYLVSPGLVIPASGYIELSFWSYNVYPGDYVKNSVLISAGSPDPTDGDYVEIWSPASVTASWEQTLLDLSAYHGQTIYIAFRYEGSFAHTWHLDDVSVSVQTPPTKTLNLTDVRLEHLFVTGTGGLMNQAYNAGGPQYTAPTADVIIVELHDAATYASVLRTYTGVALSQTGTASIPDIDLPDGNYRITIKHRNSIETTSMLPVDFTGAIVSYSFGTQASAYGNNLKLIDGFYCIFGGDVNQDGQVEGLDVSEIENGVNAFSTGYLPIDVDGDGSLGISDYSIWENNNNTFVKRVIPIP